MASTLAPTIRYRVLNETLQIYDGASYPSVGDAIEAAERLRCTTGHSHSVWTEDRYGHYVNTGDYFPGSETVMGEVDTS